MNYTISVSNLENIFNIIMQEKKEKPIFWAAETVDNNNLQIETLYALPNLYDLDLEDFFSQQEFSFDALIFFDPKIQNNQKQMLHIKNFCLDMGVYYLDILVKLQKKYPKEFPNKKVPHIESNIIEEHTSKKTPFNLIAQKPEISVPLNKTPSLKQDKKESFKIDTTILREIFVNPKDDFQKRSQQIKMIKTILDAFESSEHAFIEASTGTGKSLAYLLPSILLAKQKDVKILVATYTKNLQEQLLNKDIPKALGMLNMDINVALVKGKNNYLCLRRFFELKTHLKNSTGLFEDDQMIHKAIEKVEHWLTENTTGDLEEITPNIKPIIYDINMQTELCTKKRCPFFKNCYYFKLWDQLQSASIIITNHALLVSYMELDAKEIENDLLPDFSYIILDEAHHFPKSTLREEAFSYNLFEILITQLIGSQDKKKSILRYLGETIKKLDIGKELLELVEKIFLIENYFSKLITQYKNFEQILFENFKNKEYYTITEIEQNQLNPYKNLWQEFQETLLFMLSDIKEIKNTIDLFDETFKEQQVALYQQIEQIKQQLQDGITLWSKLFELLEKEESTLWLEEKKQQYKLAFINVNNKEFLQQYFWQKYSSIILTSATLTTHSSFHSLKHKLFFIGEAQEQVLPTCFNYKKNSLFLGVEDLPEPNSKEFTEASARFIIDCIPQVKGGILILATSIEYMNYVADLLEGKNYKRPILVQGKIATQNILNEAKQKGNAIIIGVDSFWEGIDIPGKALEMVILTKIPFRPPGHPISDLLSDIEKKAGNNPFNTITLNDAIIKFKQGFGRLLRSETDKGIIICLDHRIINKYYGKTLLSSLHSPLTRVKKANTAKIIKQFLYG